MGRDRPRRPGGGRCVHRARVRGGLRGRTSRGDRHGARRGPVAHEPRAHGQPRRPSSPRHGEHPRRAERRRHRLHRRRGRHRVGDVVPAQTGRPPAGSATRGAEPVRVDGVAAHFWSDQAGPDAGDGVAVPESWTAQVTRRRCVGRRVERRRVPRPSARRRTGSRSIPVVDNGTPRSCSRRSPTA